MLIRLGEVESGRALTRLDIHVNYAPGLWRQHQTNTSMHTDNTHLHFLMPE
jgi:hypothetical protein